MTSHRDSTFVPLTPASLAARHNPEWQAAIPAPPDSAPPFHPIHPPTTPSNPAPGHSTHGEPQVAIQRDGDKVTSIQIRCSCGQVIELACVY